MRVQELQEIIGANLKELRMAKGWTQSELAERAHVSPDFLSRAERGKRAPSTASLCRLATVLGVAPAALMAESKAASRSRAHRDLELLVRGRSESQVRLLWEVARLILEQPLEHGRNPMTNPRTPRDGRRERSRSRRSEKKGAVTHRDQCDCPMTLIALPGPTRHPLWAPVAREPRRRYPVCAEDVLPIDSRPDLPKPIPDGRPRLAEELVQRRS